MCSHLMPTIGVLKLQVSSSPISTTEVLTRKWVLGCGSWTRLHSSIDHDVTSHSPDRAAVSGCRQYGKIQVRIRSYSAGRRQCHCSLNTYCWHPLNTHSLTHSLWLRGSASLRSTRWHFNFCFANPIPLFFVHNIKVNSCSYPTTSGSGKCLKVEITRELLTGWK